VMVEFLANGLQNGVDFAKAKLGFTPDAKQAVLLREPMRRVLLNCGRQWGKSTITAAKVVHQACTTPESLVVVLSPSARRSEEFLRKSSGFVRRLGIRPRGDGGNEISLLFPNGSRVVGLPGMENIVRGFSAVSYFTRDRARDGKARRSTTVHDVCSGAPGGKSGMLGMPSIWCSELSSAPRCCCALGSSES
jgi:hypothetical protein